MKVRDWIFAAVLTLAFIYSIWTDDNRHDRIQQQIDGLQTTVAAMQKNDRLDELTADVKKLMADYRAVIQENSNLKLENQSQKEYIKWLDGMMGQ